MADRCIVCISSAHAHTPWSNWTSLTKHRFKDKIMKIFKMLAEGIKPSEGVRVGLRVTSQVTYPCSNRISRHPQPTLGFLNSFPTKVPGSGMFLSLSTSFLEFSPAGR